MIEHMKAQLDSEITDKQFEEVLTVAEVAAMLKVSHGWIHQRIHARTLPFPYFKVGHYPRFPVSGIKRFIAEQMGSAAAR